MSQCEKIRRRGVGQKLNDSFPPHTLLPLSLVLLTHSLLHLIFLLTSCTLVCFPARLIFFPKKFVKIFLVLLLVPSQEVLLQRYTETWEQWRAERPRDFEETGGGGGDEGKWYSRARMKSDLQWGIACDDKGVANTELLIWYRVATDYKRYFCHWPLQRVKT